MMNELGDVLAVLHRAPQLESFEAEGTWFFDHGAWREFSSKRLTAQPGGAGWVRMQVAGFGVFDTPSAGSAVAEEFRVWFVDGTERGASRWRVQSGRGEWVAPNATEQRFWAEYQASTTTRDPTTSRYPAQCGPILDGALLCGDFELGEQIDTVEHAGRPCWYFTANRRPSRPSLSRAFPHDSFPGTTVRVWVDQATGALLRCSEAGEKPIFELNVHRFEPNGHIPDEIFDARPPDDHPSLLAQVAALMTTAMTSTQEQDLFEDFVATGPGPEDEEEAVIDVGICCERVFDVSDDGLAMPYVQGGENLGPVTTFARQGANERTSVRVETMRFLNADEAVASVVVEHVSGDFPVTVRVLQDNGSWKVGREFIRDLYARIGIDIPPPPNG